MPGAHEGAAIEYGTYRTADEDEMVRLLGYVFSRHDPPAVAAGVEPAEFEAFVRLFCPRAAVEGLTIVARRAGTGEVVGAMLTEDCASGPPDGMDRLSAKFDPIFDILGQLDSEYRGGRVVAPGQWMHLLLLGVAESASGHGVAQKLVSTCLENGLARGYGLAVTEATNKTSQHVFRKQGFAERVSRSYGEHRFEGRSEFASIAEHGGPILMDRTPGDVSVE